MKLRNLLFAVLAAGFAFVGCEKEVDLGPAKIEASVNSLTFAATEDSQTIQITATRDWMATYDVDWIAVSPEMGEAGDAAQTVSVSVTRNDGYDRSAILEFNIGYVKTTIPVTQAGSKGEPDYGKGTKEKPYTVAGAIAYVESLGADVSSPVNVYIQGKVSKIGEEYNTQYGNGTFYISEDGTEGGKQFYCYRVLYLGNKKFTSKDTQIAVGDDVIIYGTVVNYKGNTPETVLNQAFLYELNGENRGGDEGGSGGGTSEPKGTGTEADPFNAAAANAALKAGTTTEGQTYFISGKIASIKEAYAAQFGNATFYISDNGTSGEETFYCYRVLYLNNKKWTDGDTQIKEGDEVVIAGEITLYNGTPETSANKAYLYSLKSAGSSGEEGGIKAVTNAEFLAAPVSTTQWYELTGKVSNIVSTEYGNFDLTDAAGTKVYVYGLTATKVEKNDKSFASLGIKEGDTITIITLRSEYKGEPQAGGTTPAYIKGGGETPPGPGGETGVKAVTVAEFNAAPESKTQKYQLTGVISGAINDQYGNFDLKDDTGTVYVYGLTATDLGYGTKNDQSYASLGLKAGDKITIIGYRGSYNDKIEVVYAYFVKKETSGGEQPGPGDTGEAKGAGTEADPFNVAAAIAKAVETGETATTETYYIKGKVSGTPDLSAQYGNATFKMVDTEGGAEFTAFRIKGFGGAAITGNEPIEEGDEVVICGNIVNFKGNTPETTQGGQLVSWNGQTSFGGDTPGPGEETEVKTVTVAEFNAAPESKTQKYQLTGVISGAINDQYGNFDLKDDTGTVYVYGLTATDLGYGTKNDQSYASLGLKAGDKITIIGYRGSYNDKIEVLYAYFVKKESSGGEQPGPGEEGDIKAVTNAEFLAAEVSTTQWYELTGTVSNIVNDQYGNFDLTDAAGTKVYVYGLTATKVEKNDKSFGSLGVKEGANITIISLRSEYQGSPQAGGNTPAYLKSINSQGETPGPGDDPGEPANMEGAVTVKLNNQAGWTEGEDNLYGVGFKATDASGIAMGLYKYDNNQNPREPDENSARVYKGAVMVIKAPAGRVLKAIRFKADGAENGKYCMPLTILEGGPGTIQANTTDLTIGDWSGNASMVVFQAKDGQARLVEAYVVLDGEGGSQGGEEVETLRLISATANADRLSISIEVKKDVLDFSTEKKYSDYMTLYLSDGEGDLTTSLWTRSYDKHLQFWLLYKQQIAMKQWSTDLQFEQKEENGFIHIDFSIPRSFHDCLAGDDIWIGLSFANQYTDNDEKWLGDSEDILGVAPEEGGDMFKVSAN